MPIHCIVTALPDLLKGMIVHPYTKETVQMFLRDGAVVTQAMAGQLSAAPVSAVLPSGGDGHGKVQVPEHRS